jgi:hypothetical protein
MHKIKYLLTVLLYFKSWFAYVHRYVAQWILFVQYLF